MINTLVNAQGNVVPARPSVSVGNPHREAIITAGVEMTFANGHLGLEAEQKPQLIAALMKHFSLYADDNEMAQLLVQEGIVFKHQPAACVEEIAMDIDGAELNEQQKWNDDYEPVAPLPVSSKVSVDGEVGQITGINECRPAAYSVQVGDRNFFKYFEMIEAA